jgi:hypothetical protein
MEVPLSDLLNMDCKAGISTRTHYEMQQKGQPGEKDRNTG